jgi:hypothetical protein
MMPTTLEREQAGDGLRTAERPLGRRPAFRSVAIATLVALGLLLSWLAYGALTTTTAPEEPSTVSTTYVDAALQSQARWRQLEHESIVDPALRSQARWRQLEHESIVDPALQSQRRWQELSG